MRQDGFSLIEVMVALSISAMIGVAGAGLLHQTLTSSEQIRALTERNSDIQSAHKLLFDDFANAINYPIRAGASSRLAAGFAGGNSGSDVLVEFTRVGWSNPGLHEDKSSILRTEYLVDDGLLIRRIWLRPDRAERTPYVDRAILANIDKAELYFLLRGDWLDDWTPDRPGLPDAVRFDIRFRNGRSLHLTYAVGLPS